MPHSVDIKEDVPVPSRYLLQFFNWNLILWVMIIIPFKYEQLVFNFKRNGFH